MGQKNSKDIIKDTFKEMEISDILKENNPGYQRHPDPQYRAHILVPRNVTSVISSDGEQYYNKMGYDQMNDGRWYIKEKFVPVTLSLQDYIKKYCEYITIKGVKVPVYKSR
jgi:hypothetical protein